MSESDEQTRSVAAWLSGRLPGEWTAGSGSAGPEVVVDRDEIVVTLTLPAPEGDPDDEAAAERTEAEAGRIAAFRAQTREQRIQVAREAEHRFGRKVAWAARCGGSRELFTHLAVPVMTRLRQPERVVLDTLVEAGVARSRAHALAWCVSLVGRNADTWLAELRDALGAVRRVRESGPDTPPR